MIVRRGVALWGYSWTLYNSDCCPPQPVFKDSTGNVYFTLELLLGLVSMLVTDS